ncbi:ATP phosphoribosyltransferase regulatory subunit [Natronocella acetinitrilica]|uniref:ATP phosphoribosyltransferase regulatory subunit n=1 Tax=Natronocella acetinitrilica TaxID=414046 RepID=A0AAE3G421_9GAMM|nr:ATP phosphoribosyltransferase regulatory subunit [Natronocella acetinitrilica]MCP1675017.1 ATP phosphoribosyltransferase regulatory subunit [Natronocella acetinitrilica]
MNDGDFSDDNRWMLPEAVDELLPPRARALELLRRRVLDVYERWGYELIMPPTIEYLDSLLTGTGRDLDLQTFKLTDQLSGRLMGVRADMTPQAARIDAHKLRRNGPVRLCYVGTVLHTRSEGPGQSRNPVQVGAELYGHAGVESDVEIIDLMLETLSVAGVNPPHLDLGHVGIFRALAEEAALGEECETRLFEALQRKARGEVAELLDTVSDADCRARLAALTDLNGGIGVLDQAGEQLRGAGEGVRRELQHLWALASRLENRHPGMTLHFDLAELAGYQFHTGVVFAAYVPGQGRELARGGRYDDIGRVFGRARPATGFSADLKQLLQLGDAASGVSPAAGILAPWSDDPALLGEVRRLRDAGERVVLALPGEPIPEDGLYDRELVEQEGRWRLQPRQ